jgi:dihydroorotase
MNILIKNGRVIDPANNVDANTNLFISNGTIAGIGEALDNFTADQIIDASNQIVCPGLIDICAHAREPGPSQKGSIKTESMAAIAGGITTFITPPTTSPIVDTPAVAELIKDRCAEAGKRPFARCVPSQKDLKANN